MLQYNTMRFLTDEFNPFIRQALLVSDEPVDLSNFNRLDQITVLGNQPEGSKRRFMFKMNNEFYKFDGQNLVEYSGAITLDNVLADGNTSAQLEAVSSNRDLVGKPIYPIIALYTEVQDAPTAKLVFVATNAVEQLDFNDEKSAKYFYHEDYADGKIDGKILGFSWDVVTNGAAQAGFKVQLFQNDAWSDYMTLTEAKGQIAKGYRVKWYYHVDAANGSNSVRIKSFTTHWSPDTDFNVYGDTAYLTSTVKNFGLNLNSCVLVVRYEPLDGGNIQAHASFQSKRKSISGEELGYKSNAYSTAHKFLPSTLKVYVNGVVAPASAFDILDDNQHFTVRETAVVSTGPWSVSCDYQYDADDEDWLPMTADDPEPTDNNLYTSRFFIKNPYGSAKQIGAIRLTINRGRDTKSTTRVATGEEQRVKLSHVPDEYECDAAGLQYYDYDQDTNELVFKCAEGETVTLSYDWHGHNPVIRGWQAAFAT